jgi:hypothetical protein
VFRVSATRNNNKNKNKNNNNNNAPLANNNDHKYGLALNLKKHHQQLSCRGTHGINMKSDPEWTDTDKLLQAQTPGGYCNPKARRNPGGRKQRRVNNNYNYTAE